MAPPALIKSTSQIKFLTSPSPPQSSALTQINIPTGGGEWTGGTFSEDEAMPGNGNPLLRNLSSPGKKLSRSRLHAGVLSRMRQSQH